MNIHPIFVHFPIALFTLYALLEIFRFPFLSRWFAVAKVKVFLLFVGIPAALVTVVTGGIAKNSLHIPKGADMEHIVGVHRLLALTTFTIFTLLAVSYAAGLYAQSGKNTGKQSGFLSLCSKLALITSRAYIVIPLALAGLIAVSLTAGLGGLIVYGPDFDPGTKAINALFFGS